MFRLISALTTGTTLFILFSFITYPLSAQEAVFSGVQTVCLQAVPCNADQSLCTQKTHNRVLLQLPNPLAAFKNSQIYIAECLATPDGARCTTGTADSIPLLRWEKSMPELQKTTSYQFEALLDKNNTIIDQSKNPLRAGSNGEIPHIEWISKSVPAVDRFFLAIAISPQIPANMSINMSGVACDLLHAPSIGTVFDSVSGEPLEMVTIKLMQKTGSDFTPIDTSLLPTSFIQTKAGVLTLSLPDDTYMITIEKNGYTPATSYVAPINALYEPTASSGAIFTVTKGLSQRMNFGFSPSGGTITQTDIALNTLHQYREPKTQKLIITGTTSHPETTVSAYTTNLFDESIQRILEPKVQSNKTGLFRLTIDQTLFADDERFGGIILKKNDEIIQRTDQAALQEATIALDGIPVTLTGFAYSSTGTLLKNGRAGIYFPWANAALLETDVNDQGYFSFPPNALPPIPFILRYENNEASGQATISQFLNQNAAYIKLSKLNTLLYSPDYSATKEGAQKSEPPQRQSFNFIRPVDTHPSVFWIVISALFLFGTGGIVFGIQQIKKHHHDAHSR